MNSIITGFGAATSRRIPTGVSRAPFTSTQALEGKPLLVHRNRQPIDAFTLPTERFGGNKVNLVEILLKAAKETLPEYEPFVSITGSTTYALKEDGTPDWDAVHDLDLRVHVNKEVPREKIIPFTGRFLDMLKQKGAIIINIPKEYNDAHTDLWGIRELTGKLYIIDLGVDPIDRLFTEKANKNTYHLSDAFFGDVDSINKLNKNVNAVGIKNIIKNSELFYRQVLEEIENGIKDPDTPASRKVKYLKRMYHMLVLRGKQSEYSWLLEKHKQHQAKFNKEDFKEICDQLLPVVRDTSNLEKEFLSYYLSNEKNY